MPKQKIIGAAYQDLKSIVKEYSQKDLPVLFIGETGCGKEVFINYYFEASKRRREGIIVNCAGVPETMLEAELFGHEKGAFTGAAKARLGMIRACTEGILCLDELGDASERLQAAILRVSEGGSFKPLGSDKEVNADEYNTLIIAATNKPDKIREEINHRFHILPIPPLQEFDIPELAMHFLGKPPKEGLLKELKARDYPGNVRELKKYCERLKVERGDEIFSEIPSALIFAATTFDYKRYRKELEIWNKYLQPIIDKYDLDFLKYKYLPALSEDQKHTFWFEEGLTVGEIYTRNNDKNATPGMLKLMDRIKDNAKEAVPEFKENLELQLEEGELPFLLELLGDNITTFEKMAAAKKEFLGYAPSEEPMLDMPDLSKLLDVVPEKEAARRFKKIYLQYQLNKGGQDIERTAKRLGLQPKSLIQKIQRLKEED